MKLYGTLTLCLFCAISSAQEISTDNINFNFWKPNSRDVLMAVDSVNEVLYTFGDFNYIGPSNAYIASGSISNGELNNTPLLPVYDKINCIIPDNDGGFFIGGTFSVATGSERNGLAQINADGYLTNWNPQSNLGAIPRVTAMHLIGDTLFVNGWSQTRALVGLNTVTGELIDWEPRIPPNTNLTPSVNSIESDSDFLYIGGDFSQANIAGNLGVVVSTSGDVELLNTPLFTVDNLSWLDGVHTSVSDGAGGWYVGGNFSHVGDIERHGFVHLNSNNEVTPLNWTKEGSIITAMAIDDNTLYIAGHFEEIGADGWRTLSEFGLEAQTLTDWELDIDGVPVELHLNQEKLFASGDFLYAGDYSKTIGQFDLASQSWLTNIEHQIGGRVFDIISDNNGGWILAGQISIDGEYTGQNVVHFLADGSLGELSLDFGMEVYQNKVNAIALKNDTLFVAGYFNEINGIERNGLAAINFQTNEIYNWVFDVTNRAYEFDEVKKMKCHENELFLVGDFAAVNQTPRFGIASIDLNTNELTGLNHSFNNAIQTSIRTIQDIEITNDMIFVGGSFSRVGKQIGNAVLDKDNAEIQNHLSMVDNADASVSDSHGGWYIAGDFTSIQDLERKGLAHIDSTGLVTELNLDLDEDEITDLELIDNMLIISGDFGYQILDESYPGIAVLNVNTHSLMDYNFVFNSAAQVYKMFLSGDTLFAVGNFDLALGEDRNKLAAFKLSPGQPTLLDWNPTVEDGSGYIYDIEVLHDKVIVSGTLEFGFGPPLFGESRQELAAIDRSTGELLPWNPALNGTPLELLFANNTLYMGGSFTTVDDIENKYIASFNVNDLSLNPTPLDADSTVTAMISIGNQLYVGGLFSEINGVERKSLASINLDSQVISDWYIPSDNNQYIRFLQASAEDVFVGGNFSSNSFGGKNRNSLVVLERSSYEILPYNPLYPNTGGLTPAVYDIDISDESVYIAGAFMEFDGADRQRIAKVNLEDLSLTDWTIECNEPIKVVKATIESIYLGGEFEMINGEEHNGIVAINPNNADILPWTRGFNGVLHSIASSDSEVIFGGEISAIGNTVELNNKLLVYDLDLGQLNPTGPSPINFYYNSNVNDFESSGNIVYVGGDFLTSNPDLTDLVAVNANTGELSPWNHGLEIDEVFDLSMDENLLYVLYLNGNNHHLVSFDIVSGNQTEFTLGQDYSSLSAVHAHENRIFLLGKIYDTEEDDYSDKLLEIDSQGNLISDNLNLAGTKISGNESSLFVIGSGHVDSNARTGLARYNLNTGQLDEWAPQLEGINSSNSGKPYVSDIEIHNNKIIIGGRFISIDGEPKTHLASFSQNNGALEDWSPEFNETINSLAGYNSELFVGGSFASVGGQSHKGIVSLDLETGLATDWNALLNSSSQFQGAVISKLSIQNDRLYMVGSFFEAFDEDRLNAAAVDLNSGELIEEWHFHTDKIITDLAFNNDDFFIVGKFGSAGGVAQHNAAAIDLQSGLPLDWQMQIEGTLESIDIDDNTLYLAGDGTFTTSDGTTRIAIGAIDLSTGLFNNWQPNISPFGGSYYDFEKLAVYGDFVYVAGTFDIDDEQNFGRIIAFNKNTGLSNNWTLETPRTIDFDFYQNALYLLSYENPNMVWENNIHRIDLNDQTITNTGIQVPSATKMNIINDHLFVGGEFSHIADNLRKNVASFDLSSYDLTSWNTDIALMKPRGFTEYNGKILAIGDIDNLNPPTIFPDNPSGIIITDQLGNNNLELPIVRKGSGILLYNDLLFISGDFNPTHTSEGLHHKYLHNKFNVLNLAPCEEELICQDYTLALSATENNELLVENLIDPSTGCAGVNITLSTNFFGCDDIGPNDVEVTYIDAFGNTSSCTSTINVVALEDLDLDGIGDACDLCFGDNASGDSDGDGICDDSEIVGCQDETACDFNPEATESGPCFVVPQPNCTTCDPTPGLAELILIDDDNDGVCNAEEISGCQDATAENYNPLATDNGPCLYGFSGGQGISLNPTAELDGGRPTDTNLFEISDQFLSPNPTTLWDFTPFPNPWDGNAQLQIQITPANPSHHLPTQFTLHVYDITGREIYTQKIINQDNKTLFTLTTPKQFENGTYLISITDQNYFRQTQTLVINN